ncbi:hypothetical protein G3N57_04880 [Paraburkholderia sp. Se-20369]|nr:hypothetical protein [Paraburkholderia sp. Se-20369]
MTAPMARASERQKDNNSKAGLCGFGRQPHDRLSRFIDFKFNIYLKKTRPTPPG